MGEGENVVGRETGRKARMETSWFREGTTGPREGTWFLRGRTRLFRQSSAWGGRTPRGAWRYTSRAARKVAWTMRTIARPCEGTSLLCEGSQCFREGTSLACGDLLRATRTGSPVIVTRSLPREGTTLPRRKT
jgi:hypothetical protein